MNFIIKPGIFVAISDYDTRNETIFSANIEVYWILVEKYKYYQYGTSVDIVRISAVVCCMGGSGCGVVSNCGDPGIQGVTGGLESLRRKESVADFGGR